MRILESYKQFSDNRGAFFGIVNSGKWEEINYVETEAGQVRGGHYHKETKELFYIIEGEIEIKIANIDEKNIKKYTVSRGMILVVEPFEVHTFICKTKCKWINVLSKRIDDQFHDIHLP
ncbi:MAG: cupin domain-containing protein [Candidatus Woesearchaeota archaeon]|jgi:dTDP-4-dehydrorhamnose 3,5-epimerase-like enzyme